jgi:hypothetical protein
MVRLFLTAALLAAAGSNHAQSTESGPACVERADLIKHLETKYREAPTAVGLADNGSLLEVFASRDGETWTVTVTMPNGISCMVATGQQWQSLLFALPDPES